MPLNKRLIKPCPQHHAQNKQDNTRDPTFFELRFFGPDIIHFYRVDKPKHSAGAKANAGQNPMFTEGIQDTAYQNDDNAKIQLFHKFRPHGTTSLFIDLILPESRVTWPRIPDQNGVPGNWALHKDTAHGSSIPI